MLTDVSNVAHVFSPIQLPCGIQINNRLVKVAMYEHLASLFGGPPNLYHFQLYSAWAKYDWGMIITGNVQVLRTHLSLGRDMIIPESVTSESISPFEELSSVIHGKDNRNIAIMQLNHSGRQSSNLLGGRYPFQPPLAPSPLPIGAKASGLLYVLIHKMLFQKPRAMTYDDIDEVVSSFVKGAVVAAASGFDGVQLHVAHGSFIDLLAQFISPKSNVRTDEYSSEKENALRLLHRITSSIREVVPSKFILGIKLNASDYTTSQTGEQLEDRALEHLITISQWGDVDFIEVSGGDYEHPDFMATTPHSPRQAFFHRFSHQALKALDALPETSKPPPLILLTGGLLTPALIHKALSSRHAQLLGIGRGSVLRPDLPELLKTKGNDQYLWDDAPFQQEPDLRNPHFLGYLLFSWFWGHVPNIALVGAGVNMAWYVVAIRGMALRIGSNGISKPNYSIGGLGAVVRMWAWTPWDTYTAGTSYRILFLFSVVMFAILSLGF